MILDRRRAIIAAAPAVQIALTAPIGIFAVNPDFANVMPSALVALGGLAFVVLFAAFAGLLAVARARWVASVLVALAVVATVEQAILLRFARHGTFDGTPIDWHALRLLGWFEIGIAIVILVIALRPRVHLRHLAVTAAFLVVFHVVGLLVHVPALWQAHVDQGTTQTERVDYFGAFARLSPRRNIIHLVVDHTQGALVHALLNERLDQLGPALDGFTHFVQASGRYPSTYPSISFYMTGRYPEPAADEVESLPLSNETVRATLDEHSVVNVLAEAGFATFGATPTQLYCAGDYDTCQPIDILSGLPEIGSRWDAVVQYARLVDIALFRATPVFARQHVFRDGQWLLTSKASDVRVISGVLDEFMRRLTVDDEGPDTYNYLHHPGGHPPIQFNATCDFVGTQKWTRDSTAAQLRCFLAQLIALVQRLEQLGVYDQTMIVVHGDHGSQWPSPLVGAHRDAAVTPNIMGMANPLLLVKPFDARGPLRFSHAPASLRDVPATLARAVEKAAELPGQDVFQLAEDMVRERQFLYYRPGAANIYRDGNLGPTTRYRIRGNLFDPFAWVPPASSAIVDAPNHLRAVDPRFDPYADGIAAERMTSMPNWRYVEGRRARLYLTAPAPIGTSLDLRIQVPDVVATQRVEVWLAGQHLASLSGKSMRERKTHTIPIPGGIAPGLATILELRMSAEATAPDHQGSVSLRFHSAALLGPSGLETP